MGQIVAALATVHAPQLFTRPPEEDPKQLDASIAAMRKLGRVLDEARPMRWSYLPAITESSVYGWQQAHGLRGGNPIF